MLLRRTLPAVALAVALAGPPARAAEQLCTGTLSGLINGTFTCTVAVKGRAGDAARVIVTPGVFPKDLTAFMPVMLDIKGKGQVVVYTFETFKAVKIALTTRGHAGFVVIKKTDKAGKVRDAKGDVTLRLTDVQRRDAHDDPVVKGTIEARLVPSSPKIKGEVLMKIAF